MEQEVCGAGCLMEAVAQTTPSDLAGSLCPSLLPIFCQGFLLARG